MGRAPCCDKANVKRGAWSPDEDQTLVNYLRLHGTAGNWIALPLKAGLRRCGKSCRLRWLNYLRPNIKHGNFTQDEDNIIYNLYTQMGSRWSVIASQLPGRTDNDVKNYWNTKLKKKIFGVEKSKNVTSKKNRGGGGGERAPQHFPSSHTQKLEIECEYEGLNNQPINVIGLNRVQNSSSGGVMFMGDSMENSSISDSTSACYNTPLLRNGCCDTETGILMEFGFGFGFGGSNAGCFGNYEEEMRVANQSFINQY